MSSSIDKQCVLGYDVMNDIEMFKAYDEKFEDNTVIKQFEKNLPNEGSKQNLQTVLETPIFDFNMLQLRQTRLQLLQNKLPNVDTQWFEDIRINEENVKWLLENKHEQESGILDSLEIVYFRWKLFNKCNESSYMLNLKNLNTVVFTPICSVFSPFLSFCLPYLILRYKFKFQIPFTLFIRTVVSIIVNTIVVNKNVNYIQCITYILSIIIYFQSIYNMFDSSRNTYNVYKLISKKIKGIRKYLQKCKDFFTFFDYNVEKNQSITKILKIKHDLVLYHMLRTNKDQYLDIFKDLIDSANELFSYIAVIRTITNYNMCYTEFKHMKRDTYIDAQQMYHICLPDAVKNDILLNKTNCVITGPNAAGKSTFIKGLVVNVLLSQTFGIACARRFIITPFYHINTQINIPDVKGKDSLFEAEMNRCKNNLDILTDLSMDKKCLFVMDEIFNSTNVVEGVAGSYAILNKMGSYSNSCNVVTTHYIYLTKLIRYLSLKMESVDYTFDYKLKKGVSKQYLALEMLKQKFPPDVITEALKIKKKLLV